MTPETLCQMENIDATKCNCGAFADHRLVLLLSTLGGKLTRRQKASKSIPICKRCVRKGGVVGAVSLRQSLKAVLTHCAGALICAVLLSSGCAWHKQPAQAQPVNLTNDKWKCQLVGLDAKTAREEYKCEFIATGEFYEIVPVAK